MQYYGYAGNILNVDLTSGRIKTEALDMELARKFIGGSGLSRRLLYDILKPGIDPLSPNNVIAIGAGPLVGTLIPGSGKIQLLTKSATPANKEQSRYYVGVASGGSNRFGVMMKSAGYDQIVITGRAKQPVYLKIENEDVEICPADDLWGKDVYETHDELVRRHTNSGVLTIGRGGENLVSFALALLDKRDTMGRNGGGTIMGSKNLKAVAVYGTRGIRIADPDGLMKLANRLREKTLELTDFKVPGAASAHWQLGGKWAPFYPHEIWRDTLCGRFSCSGCPIACKDSHRIKGGEFSGTMLESGRFALVPIYGRKLELKDYRDSMKLLDAANRSGICFMTAVAMIRFVCLLYERGIITTKDTNGLELKTGDIHTYLELMEKIATREGIGDAMARGWYALSARVGVDASTDEDGDGIVKGSSTLFDGRFVPLEPCRFECMVNPRGGMHNHPLTYYDNQSMDSIREFCRGLAMPQEAIDRIVTADGFNCGRFERHIEDGESVYFSLGVCTRYIMRQIINVRLLADLYLATTGIRITPEELKKAGERIWNVYKLLNVREGFSRADDVCPGLWAKTIDEPIKTSKGDIRLRDYFGKPLAHADLDKMLDDYYDERGWDINTGVPTKNKLTELGLGDLPA